MSGRIILIDPVLAKAPVKPPVKPQNNQNGATLWMGASGVLLLAVIGLAVFSQIKLNQLAKKLRMEDFKNRELQKKYKLAVGTITKMEKNPDLVHSREFNLDYLRMRMAEETFHFSIVNQIRVKVKDKISLALRPTQETRGVARQVDEVFDVEYETGEGAELKKRVLFRIQIRLTKIPTQPTSVTIGQIIDCIETYLSTTEDNDSWQPTIQGRVAYIHWDQKAKPTPLLVLEQSNEGVNVTFATKRRGGPASTQEQIAETKPQTSLTAGRRSSLTAGKNEKTAGKPGKSSDKTSGRSTKTGKR